MSCPPPSCPRSRHGRSPCSPCRKSQAPCCRFSAPALNTPRSLAWSTLLCATTAMQTIRQAAHGIVPVPRSIHSPCDPGKPVRRHIPALAQLHIRPPFPHHFGAKFVWSHQLQWRHVVIVFLCRHTIDSFRLRLHYSTRSFLYRFLYAMFHHSKNTKSIVYGFLMLHTPFSCRIVHVSAQ